MSKTLTNQAQVSFSFNGSTETRTNYSNIVTSNVKESYDFSAEKTANVDCFKAGDRVTYSIHIVNDGCGCLGSFTINDDFCSEDYATFVTGSGVLMINGSMTSITPTDLTPLTFVISNNLNKNSELVLQYSVDINQNISSEVDEIKNTATITACPCNPCESINGNKASYCVTKIVSHTLPKCEYAEVLITKAVSNDNVCCEDELDYIITLTNTGNVDATNVIVSDSLPEEFKLMSIRMENNGDFYTFSPDEYTLSAANYLTLPNATGTRILVPSLAPGVDNTTRIRIHGHI